MPLWCAEQEGRLDWTISGLQGNEVGKVSSPPGNKFKFGKSSPIAQKFCPAGFNGNRHRVRPIH